MSAPGASLGRRLADGATWTAAASLLALPTGAFTAAVLARGLGPEDYGVLALAGTTIALIEYGLKSLFARPGVQSVAAAADWRAAAGALLRLHLVVYGAAAAALWLASDGIAARLGAPALADVLRLFAVELPLFALAQAHHQVLVGRGLFRARAAATAAYWIARAVFVATAASLGLSLHTAVVALVAATCVELAVCRWNVAPPWAGQLDGAAARTILRAAAVLAPAEIALRVLAASDLLALAAFGASATLVGAYGAASHLPVAATLAGGPLSLLALSSATQALREGDVAAARALGTQAIRVLLLGVPPAVLVGAVAPELLVLLFGADYAVPAPVVLSMLLGAAARLLTLVAFALLAANGRPGWTAVLGLPLLPCAALGYAVLVPKLGLAGAAGVSAAVSIAGAAAALFVVHHLLGVPFPAQTCRRVAALATAAYAGARLAPMTPEWVPLQILALGGLIAAAYAAMGEWTAARPGVGRRLTATADRP